MHLTDNIGNLYAFIERLHPFIDIRKTTYQSSYLTFIFITQSITIFFV